MNKMKILKIMLAVLVLGTLSASLLSCGSESDEGELPENQVVAVQRGDITIDITAAGNLALSRTEDLAIDLFYQEGTLAEILVEEGDTVEEGQVLAKLDTDEWDDELSALEDDVITEERASVQAQVNLLTAEQNLKNARDNEATKELAVLNAQISLDQALIALRTGIAAADFNAADAQLRRAKSWYNYLMGVGREVINADDYLLALERAEEQLEVTQTEYDNLLAGYGSNDVAIKKQQVEAAEGSLASAREDLADVARDVELKELQVTLNEGKVTDALKAIADAREELEDAQSKSPEITAPFAGFITTVNVEGGDEVLKGTVAVQLADPNKFEADILVSEMDILQVKLGGEALVEVDAMTGRSLPAEVTHIAPTATISSGVVNYEVKVEIQSLQAVMSPQPEARQRAMEAIAAGELPEGLKRAVEAGRMTQEQAEEILKQGPPPGMQRPPGMEGQAGSGQAGQGRVQQAPMAVPEDFQLRDGLTVTVTIIVEEKTDVLLVPNAAVTSQGMQSIVQVVSPSGETEERAIQTGIADYQFTEVTEGLNEGEQILVTQGTNTAPASTPSGPSGMPFFRPPRR